MDNILSITDKLKDKSNIGNYIWTCSCGGDTYYVVDDGTLECSSCNGCLPNLRTFDITEN